MGAIVYVIDQYVGDRFAAYNCDTVEFTAEMPDNSIDFSVYSPPFSSLYIYSESERDMGNVDSDEMFFESYRPLIGDLFRVTRPGRLTAIHIKDLVYYSNSSEKGDRGLKPFMADCIKAHIDEGWTYHRLVTIWRCPVKEMQKTKADRLLYKHFRQDAARTGGGLPEYLAVFRKWAPGMEETAPVLHDPNEWPVETWQEWASPIWMSMRETDVLNAKVARNDNAEKHLCLASGSDVLTIDGFKAIEDVEVGEFVLTHKGRWRPVIAKKYTGVRPVVTVRAQGVPGLTLTPDHNLWARLVPQSGKWDPCFSRRRAEVAEPAWARADQTLGSYLNLKLPPQVEGTELSDSDWWIVGRWLGDGHIGTRGELIISCGGHEVTALSERLGERCGITYDTGTAVQIRVKDRGGSLRSVISKCGRGAANKQFPAEAFSLPTSAAKAVLDGYMSADGSFLASRNRYMVTCISRRLLLGAAMLFQRVYGAVASVYAGREERQSVIAGRDVSCRQEWVLSANIPHDGRRVSPFLLDDGAWLKVRSIEESGAQGTWCLRVEEDESFTAEGCIVKNCPMPLDITRRAVLQYTNPGDVIYSPFMGIGSEGYQSLKEGRRFIGTELNGAYFAQAVQFLREASAVQNSLFAGAAG